jgi:hypothetical protein
MRWICLCLGISLLTFLPAHAGHTAPKIFLRIHVQTTGEGQSAQEATTITIPSTNEQIQIRTLPDVTEQELIAVSQDATGLHLQFNHPGTVDLDAVTAQNQGRLLVVMIDASVIYAPIIDQEITNGHLEIPHQMPPQIITLLQQVVQQNLKQAART